MKWLLFPVAVVATSLAVIAALAVIFALPARAVLASTLGVGGFAGNAPWAGGPWFNAPGWHGGPWGHGSHVTLPPELQGLADLPTDQRFSHFLGVQVTLKDKDDKPLTVTVTPGTVTSASATSITVAANDGTTKTFAINDQTMLHGLSAANSGQTSAPTLATGDTVVVVTMNNSTTATAVIAGGPSGFGWPPPDSSWGSTGNAH